jgi:hypothetical protein
MSGAQPTTRILGERSGATALVAALVGGRRAGRNARRDDRRSRGATTDAAPADEACEDPVAGPGTRASDPVGDQADPGGVGGAGSRTRTAKASRRGSGARERRRLVEAQLIGLHDGGAVDPPWWGPCWERGLDADLPADRVFDALQTFHPDVRVLHDLRVAGTAMAIDHVLIGPGGVVVADTESCEGRVRSDGVHLRVRGRDRSPMIDVALWQAEVVRATLERKGLRDVRVHGVLHWQHLEGLGARAICLRGVPLLSAGATMGLAATGVDVSPLGVERIAAALEPACTQH